MPSTHVSTPLTDPQSPNSIDLLSRIDRLLVSLEVRPVPLTQWRAAVLAAYQDRRPMTRYRMRQALDAAVQLSELEATTAALTARLVALVACRRPDWRAETTNGVLRALRAAIRFAIARRWTSSDALYGARWTVRDGRPPRKKHHSRAEIAQVLADLGRRAQCWRTWRLYALAMTFAHLGLRRGEALAMRWEDLDLAGSVLWVTPHGTALKTEAARAGVPMPRALVEVLMKWRRWNKSPWVFPGRRMKGPWTGGAVGSRATDCLRRAGEAVGVKGFTPLSLRHSLGTHLRGHYHLSGRQVQQILRHTTERTQDRYVHPELADLVAAVRDVRFDAGPG
jgi:integrase